MDGLTSKHLGMSKIKSQADLVSGEEALPGLQMEMAVFSLYPHLVEERSRVSSSFHKGINPSMRAPLS